MKNLAALRILLSPNLLSGSLKFHYQFVWGSRKLQPERKERMSLNHKLRRYDQKYIFQRKIIFSQLTELYIFRFYCLLRTIIITL